MKEHTAPQQRGGLKGQRAQQTEPDGRTSGMTHAGAVSKASGKVSRCGRQGLPHDGCSYHWKMPCNRPVLKQQAGSPRAASQGCRLPGLFSPDGDSRDT